VTVKFLNTISRSDFEGNEMFDFIESLVTKGVFKVEDFYRTGKNAMRVSIYTEGSFEFGYSFDFLIPNDWAPPTEDLVHLSDCMDLEIDHVKVQAIKTTGGMFKDENGLRATSPSEIEAFMRKFMSIL